MKKRQISADHKAEPLDSILGVDIGIPSSLNSETGIAVMTAENLINAYEKEAREILKRDGYPLTLEELWAKKDEVLPDLATGQGISQVYSIFWMLWFLKSVRVNIEKNNADMVVCEMACALYWATIAQLKPIAPLFDMGKKNVDGGILGGIISGKVRREKAKPTQEAWQAEAEEIWKKNYALSNKRAAERIAKKSGGKVDTIRKSIKKPLP
ncbi:MAG: hypothetical protein ABSB79_13685 [Syntrophales bacterium]